MTAIWPTGESLVLWAKPYLSSTEKLKSIIDGGMEGQYSENEALEAAQLILKCIDDDPKQRPSMRQVLEGLEVIETIHENFI